MKQKLQEQDLTKGLNLTAEFCPECGNKLF